MLAAINWTASIVATVVLSILVTVLLNRKRKQ